MNIFFCHKRIVKRLNPILNQLCVDDYDDIERHNDVNTINICDIANVELFFVDGDDDIKNHNDVYTKIGYK